MIDSDGRPTTDGSLYPLNAALAPMTGHKGYGIALLHEHLAGVLTGASISWQVLNWIFDDPEADRPRGRIHRDQSVGHVALGQVSRAG